MTGSQFEGLPPSIPIYPVNPTCAITSSAHSPCNSAAPQKKSIEVVRSDTPVASQSFIEDPNRESGANLNAATQEYYPEGGYGWFVVAAAFVISFWTLGVSLCYGIFEEYFLDSQFLPGTSPQSLFWVGSVGVSCMFAGAPVIVVLNARLGCWKVLSFGVLLASVGFISSSFSTTLWHLFFSLSIPVGLGGCVLYFTATTVLSQYFYKRRAFAFAIAAIGSSIGGAVMSPFIRYLLTKLGFPATARILGCMLFVSTGIASCFVKPRIPFSGPVPIKNDAESAGEVEHQGNGGSPENAEARPPVVALTELKFNVDFTVLKSLSYSLLFLATILFALSYQAPIGLVPSYATSIGLSTTQSALLVSISSVTTIASRVTLGYVADRWGVFNTMLMCTLIGWVTCLALWKPAHSFATLAAFMGIFGGFQGTLFLLLPVAASKTVTLDRMPSAMAFNFFALILGFVLGAPLTSLIVASEHGGNRGVALFVAGIAFVCFVIMAIIRLRTSRKAFVACNEQNNNKSPLATLLALSWREEGQRPLLRLEE